MLKMLANLTFPWKPWHINFSNKCVFFIRRRSYGMEYYCHSCNFKDQQDFSVQGNILSKLGQNGFQKFNKLFPVNQIGFSKNKASFDEITLVIYILATFRSKEIDLAVLADIEQTYDSMNIGQQHECKVNFIIPTKFVNVWLITDKKIMVEDNAGNLVEPKFSS